MTLAGLGMALVVAPLSSAVMAGAGSGDGGTASGINNAVARMAGLMAVAATGALAAAVYGWMGGTGSFGLPATTDAARSATSASFAAVAAVASAFAFLSAALALGLKRRT